MCIHDCPPSRPHRPPLTPHSLSVSSCALHCCRPISLTSPSDNAGSHQLSCVTSMAFNPCSHQLASTLDFVAHGQEPTAVRVSSQPKIFSPTPVFTIRCSPEGSCRAMRNSPAFFSSASWSPADIVSADTPDSVAHEVCLSFWGLPGTVKAYSLSTSRLEGHTEKSGRSHVRPLMSACLSPQQQSISRHTHWTALQFVLEFLCWVSLQARLHWPSRSHREVRAQLYSLLQLLTWTPDQLQLLARILVQLVADLALTCGDSCAFG